MRGRCTRTAGYAASIERETIMTKARFIRAGALAAAAALTISLAACGTEGNVSSTAGADPAQNSDDQFRIALVTGLITHSFYVDMRAGAEAEAEKLGVELQYDGAAQWDPTVQIPVLDAVRTTKPDFLLVVPVNDTALNGPIQQFTAEGTPVATVDTDLADKSARLVNFTSDNYNGGVIIAEALAEAVGEKGKVGLLCYNPGITVNDQRRAGFEDTIKQYPDIEYVGSQLMNNSTEVDQVLPPFLTKNPDLKGLATCDGNSTGRSAAIIAERGDDVKVAGFDVDEDLINGLKNGRIAALAVQQTQEMGAAAVRWAYEYLQGEEPAAEDQTLEFVKVTLDNLETPEAQKVVGQYDK